MQIQLYIFKHFAESKKLFFAKSIILRLIHIKFETLKPPSVEKFVLILVFLVRKP